MSVNAKEQFNASFNVLASVFWVSSYSKANLTFSYNIGLEDRLCQRIGLQEDGSGSDDGAVLQLCFFFLKQPCMDGFRWPPPHPPSPTHLEDFRAERRSRIETRRKTNILWVLGIFQAQNTDQTAFMGIFAVRKSNYFHLTTLTTVKKKKKEGKHFSIPFILQYPAALQWNFKT